MAGYTRKELQILGGSFNLLPPGDKTPKTDYLLAQNWRTDQLGRLVSRYGYPQKFQIAGPPYAHSAAIHGGVEGDYYIGAGNNLYYNFAGAAIAAGFDGSRVGFAPMNGFMWVMNRGNQGRHSRLTTTVNTTIAASIAVGSQTVTPASMTGISVGSHLGIQNAGGSNLESVTVTATTGTTFTATFALTKTGPGIVVQATTGGWEPWGVAPPATACTAAGGAGAPSTVTSVTYTYSLQGDANYEHSLTIAGQTYAFAENGYGSTQLATVIAALAASDPNCQVTAGAGGAVTIVPTASGVLIPVSGSDGNSSANLAIGYSSPASYPNGTYQFYVTFEESDQEGESNPGPPSAPVTVSNSRINLTNIPVSADPRVGIRNIYATGGTLGNAYLVAVVNDNSTTTATVSISDAAATNQGIEMPTTNDPPPAAAGLLGPYFSRLLAWNTAAHPNRLFWTDPGKPQYFPGSGDPAIGNWVDVGMDGEAIVWCSQHTNLVVIYKERSIWRLVGDPDTGTLEQIVEGVGLVNPWALAPAGSYDYFVAPGGLHRCNLDSVEDFSGNIRPLFTLSSTNTGAMTPPGSILPGRTYLANAGDCYWVSLGYAMGKLYLAYNEQASGTSSCLLVFDESSRRWFYHRAAAVAPAGFQGFLFDGIQMVGLTGNGANLTLGFSLDDFRNFYTQDTGPTPIACVYQSHYEDCGAPDNQKVWLEVVIDYEFQGDSANVYIGLDNGALVNIGSITGTGRKQTSLALAINGGSGAVELKNPASTTQKDVLAKNLSVAIQSSATLPLILHNVYLYYYEEARLALQASTLPTDLGIPRVKQVKELMLDIDATGGTVTGAIYSDLPGNALALRQSPAISSGGRAVWKYPFSVTEGYLWRLTLAANSGPFRLYSARLLARVIGTYVEAYEAAAGFVWDSQELTFESGITHIPRGYAIALAAMPIKRAREISLQIDTFNANVRLDFLSDLPGNAQTSRFNTTINTGTAGRRFVRIPLPAGTSAPIEGRIFRIQLSGSAKFILYEAAVEILAVGVYVEAYEAAGGAVYDSREIDFGSAKPKEFRELELDIETTGNVTATLYSDLPSPYQMAQVFQSTTVSTTGRQKMKLPLALSTAPYSYPMGRMGRLILTGTNALRLYGAKLRLREFGTYLTGDEASASPVGVWDSTPLDFGTERLKDFKNLEFEIQTDAPATLTIWTDQPNGALTQQFQTTITTGGARQTVKVPLTPGIRGRLLQAELSGAGVRLFSGRVWWRAMNDPKAQWDWAPFPIEPTAPEWAWAPFPVNPTEPQWFWAKVLAVDETSDKWEWVEVPFEVTGS